MAHRRLVLSLVAAAVLGVAALIATAAATTVAAKSARREHSGSTALKPFGRLSCKAEYGVRFCQGNGTTERVPSFDGVPLDADVTLPARGRGPFPLIVMLHGLGANKTEYETTRNDGSIDNVSFAARGWAVLTYTARGFGNSCGTAASRAGTPGCARGWIRLADQRYEVRDTQYLSGLLVDEGIAKPSIAVTGVSYGGGQTLELAMLKNRMRLTDGELVPWVSPIKHIPMSVGAAYAEWGWDDLVTALTPNGHLSQTSYTKPAVDLAPGGIEKQSWDQLLYLDTTLFDLAPKGSVESADLTTWFDAAQAGEPYTAADRSYAVQEQTYHSAIGIPMAKGGPAPTIMQNGWTDTLFPVTEALHWSSAYEADHVDPPLLQIFDDVGHGWAQGKPTDIAKQTHLAEEFLDDEMLSHKAPPTGVLAIGTTCPRSALSSPTVWVRDYAELATGSTGIRHPSSAVGEVTSSGGSATIAAHLNPAYSAAFCQSLAYSDAPGTARYVVVPPSADPTIVVGGLRVSAQLHITGDYPELVARLWDVDPATHTEQLVEATAYRPSDNQGAGTSTTKTSSELVEFELPPNLWTLAGGHSLVLELVGSSAPWFRKSNGTFQIAVHNLTATIGTR
jgi:pimeloyl-ACP methyl ester carboxylesterase